MANVFTRRSGLPRTTTLKDFRDPELTLHLATRESPNDRLKIIERQQPRPRSPTRIQNPQPAGLIYQQPLKQGGTEIFGIWHPKYQGPRRERGRLFDYTKRINFTCNHDVTLYKSRKEPSDRTKSLGHQYDKITSRTFKNPKMDMNSIPTEQRSEYHWFDNYKYKYNKVTGYSAAEFATGIVPDVFGWSRFETRN